MNLRVGPYRAVNEKQYDNNNYVLIVFTAVIYVQAQPQCNAGACLLARCGGQKCGLCCKNFGGLPFSESNTMLLDVAPAKIICGIP